MAKSDFWDPAYVVESMGTGLVMNDNLKNKFGFAVKETFTRKYRTYSDDTKSTDYQEWIKIEPGLNCRSVLSLKVNSMMKFSSTLELFSNIQGFKEVDIRWDNNLSAKVVKYVSVNLSAYILYDKNMTPKTQIKQFLGIGFMYDIFGT